MALDDLQEVIEKFKHMIDTHHDYLSGKERRTRQVLIDPLLNALGWDVSDPGAVYLEHNQMDYALMSDDNPVAVVEAKPLGKSLETSKATSQSIAYAVENNIPYIVVTDGDKWKMYEVFKQQTLEDRKLMEFQLSKDLSQDSALQALRIWKPNLATGRPNAKRCSPVLRTTVSRRNKGYPCTETLVDDSARSDADTIPPAYDGLSSTQHCCISNTGQH